MSDPGKPISFGDAFGAPIGSATAAPSPASSPKAPPATPGQITPALLTTAPTPMQPPAPPLPGSPTLGTRPKLAPDQPSILSYPGAALDAALKGDNGIENRGAILPVGRDKATGKIAFVWPEMARSVARGVMAFNPAHPGDPNDPQTQGDVFNAASLFTGGRAIVKADEIATETVSGRAAPGVPPGEGPPGGATPQQAARMSAAGEPADASKVTFRAKPNGFSSDAWHNVGTMDKGDLQRFYDQANSYAGKSPEELNVTEANAPELHQGIGQFNIANMKSPGDVPLFIRAALDNIPKQVRPMTAEDLAASVSATAEAIGSNRDTITTFINNVARDASNLPQATGMVRAAVQSIHGAIDADAKLGLGGFEDGDLETARGHFDGTAAGPMSPEEGRGAELAKRLLNLQTGINWTAGLNDIGTGAGRTLQSLQQPAVTLDDLMEHLRTLGADAPSAAPGSNFKAPDSLQALDKFNRLWLAAGDDPASRAALLSGKPDPKLPEPGWYLRNSFANAFTGSLLAGKAIVKGYVMPAFMGAIETTERVSGGALMGMNPMLDAETRQAGRNIAKASAMSYYQTMGDFAAAWRYSIDAMKNGGQSIIGGGYSAMQQSQRLGPVTQEMLDAADKPGDLRYILGNAINTWPRAVFSLIGGHDELTKQLAYAGRIRMQAINYGLRNGLSGQDLTDLVHQSLADAVNPATKAATYSDVLNEAARTSFINKPDGPMAPVINALNSARSAYPELRYVLPVLDVPANALGAMMSRIPGISAFAQGTRDDLMGRNGDIAKAQAYGRWITGATAMGAGFGLCRAGLLTGGGPQNAADKANWMNNGYQPYSIQIGGKWISYKDWEPVGGILGIIGTTCDHTVHYAEDDQTHSKVVAAVAALAEYTKDKAAMKGVSDLLSFGDADSAQQYVSKLTGSVPAGFIPAFVRYGRNAADDDLRDTKAHWFDQVLNEIPGVSQELPPLRNVMGEPIHTPNDASNLYGLLPLTIASARQEGKDPVTDELDKVYQLTGSSIGVTHPAEISHNTFDPRSQTTENGRPMYDQFIQNRMLPNPLLDGKNTKDALADLFATDDYQKAVYGSPTKAADALGNPSKLKMIENVFNAANKYSLQQLAAGSPTAKRYIAVGNAKSDSPDLLRSHTADELAGNPKLLSQLGINIQEYENKATGQ